MDIVRCHTGSMTFEERLERITEKHQALAESMEIWIASTQEHNRQYEDRFGKLLTLVEALTHAVESHERRLTRFEDETR